MSEVKLICIGTSAGGVTALQRIFEGLPKLFSIPIVVVQHLPSHAQLDLDLVFGRFFQGRLLEITDKIPLEKGNIYFAPADYHVLLENDFTLSLSQDEPVHFARPSIDVFFESVAALPAASATCGILLTGANSDGAAGMQCLKKFGALTIVQDPADAEVPSMPRAALGMMKPDWILPLDKIPTQLIEISRRVSS